MHWRTVFLGLAVLFVLNCSGESDFYGKRSDELTVIAKCDVREGKNGPQAVLLLTLVNTSQRDLKILTKNPGVSTDGHTFLQNFLVSYRTNALKKGTNEPFSIEDLSPVTLKPGEVVRMLARYPYPFVNPPDTRTAVVYHIQREFAEKHGLWSGWTESQPSEPRMRSAANP